MPGGGGHERDIEDQIRKERQGPREAREEIAEEIRSGTTEPLLRQPNRDRARGDWDRTGDHHDVDASRAPDEDEGFDERS